MTVGKRVHALFLERFMGRYETLVESRKRELFAGLRGDVLEIGPGAGSNFRFYAGAVRVLGVEPNPYLHPYLRRKAEARGLLLSLVASLAEALPVPDNSADAVVSTLVLCSVRDPARVLSEIRRVLKPGGQFAFLEHVAAEPGSRTRRRQEWIRPFWRCAADGCHPDRETAQAIESAGFRRTEIDRFRLNLPVIGPHLAGRALK